MSSSCQPLLQREPSRQRQHKLLFSLWVCVSQKCTWLPCFQLILSNTAENIWKICLLSIDHDMGLNILLRSLMLKVSVMQVVFFCIYIYLRTGNCLGGGFCLFDFNFLFICWFVFTCCFHWKFRLRTLLCLWQVCLFAPWFHLSSPLSPWHYQCFLAGTECWQLNMDTASINVSLYSSEDIRKVDRRSGERVVGWHEKCARVSASSWYLNLSVGFEVPMSAGL